MTKKKKKPSKQTPHLSGYRNPEVYLSFEMDNNTAVQLLHFDSPVMSMATSERLFLPLPFLQHSLTYCVRPSLRGVYNIPNKDLVIFFFILFSSYFFFFFIFYILKRTLTFDDKSQQ